MMTSLRVTPARRRVFLIDTGMLSSYYKAGGHRPSHQGADVRVIYEEANAEGSSPAAALSLLNFPLLRRTTAR